MMSRHARFLTPKRELGPSSRNLLLALVLPAETARAADRAALALQARLELERIRLDRLRALLTEESELRTRQQQVVDEMQLLVAKQSRVVQGARASAAKLQSLLHEGLSDAEWAGLSRFFVDHMRGTGAGGLRRYAPGQVPSVLHEDAAPLVYRMRRLPKAVCWCGYDSRS